MSKYGNQKTAIDGITFDSKREANRYCELRLLEKAGQIKHLGLQKRFEIVPKTKYGKALHYVADFVYQECGKMVVEDAKGVRTQVYCLKKRLMAELYNIEIREV